MALIADVDDPMVPPESDLGRMSLFRRLVVGNLLLVVVAGGLLTIDLSREESVTAAAFVTAIGGTALVIALNVVLMVRLWRGEPKPGEHDGAGSEFSVTRRRSSRHR